MVNNTRRVQHQASGQGHEKSRLGYHDRPILKSGKQRLRERKSFAEVMWLWSVSCQNTLLPREDVADGCSVSPAPKLQAGTARPRPVLAFQGSGKTQPLPKPTAGWTRLQSGAWVPTGMWGCGGLPDTSPHGPVTPGPDLSWREDAAAYSRMVSRIP